MSTDDALTLEEIELVLDIISGSLFVVIECQKPETYLDEMRGTYEELMALRRKIQAQIELEGGN